MNEWTGGNDMDKILVNASAAAAMLSIGRSTFFRKVSEGALPKPISIGGVVRWSVDDLRAVARSSQPTTASSADAEAGIERGYTQP